MSVLLPCPTIQCSTTITVNFIISQLTWASPILLSVAGATVWDACVSIVAWSFLVCMLYVSCVLRFRGDFWKAVVCVFNVKCQLYKHINVSLLSVPLSSFQSLFFCLADRSSSSRHKVSLWDMSGYECQLPASLFTHHLSAPLCQLHHAICMHLLIKSWQWYFMVPLA